MSKLLADHILGHSIRTPRAPALLCGGATVTYAELAGLVRRAIPDPGTLEVAAAPIGLRATKTPASIATVIAAHTVGRPVFLPSPELGGDALAELSRRAGCAVPPAEADGAASDHSGAPVPGPGPAAGLPADTSFLLTTSGSTGLPKLVPLGGGAVDRFTAWAAERFGIGPGTRVLSFAPLNFDLSLLDVWATLRRGGCVVLVDPERAANPRYLASLLSDTRPHVVQAVPMFFRLLAEGAGPGDGFAGVRHVLLTGDHASRTLRRRVAEMFPDARFHNVYGCTETNDSMLYSCTGEEVAEREVLPLGRPLPGVRVSLRDGEDTVDGPGVGELVVSTPFQADGYLGQEAEGGRFFRTHSGADARTWFRTGDLVRRSPDGELTLVGRTDFQVKVAGVRINPEEVERVILSHRMVRDAAVVAVPDPLAGTRLCALVRPHPGTSLTALKLLAHCSARLVRPALPTVRVTQDPLPVGPTGKPDRSRIRDAFSSAPGTRPTP
ncbi:AMP-binding protein [Streptomyces sp. NPDC001848]|uniref:AMP-binding protein n=1 Tax=Streptomyces sp. NPDC001848 TaxID=3364618 RepID=UPI003686E6D4